MVKKRKMIRIDIEMPRVVVNTLIKELNKPRASSYVPKKENINKLRNAIDTMFLDGECGILRNNEIIINDEEVEYTEEQPDKLSESTGKYIGSGLSVLGVKNLVMKGDFIFHCGSCDTDVVYAEYNGRNSFNFQVKDDLRLTIGYCSSCERSRQQKWDEKNKGLRSKNVRDWQKNNKEKHLKIFSRYVKKRRKYDPVFKLTMNIRSRTKEAFKRSRWNKNSSNKEMLGCSFETAHKHLEIQFTKGMSWDNYGKWHIDHIIPLSSANTEEELKLLCHHKNLQPLWASDNLIKSNKYDEKEKVIMLETIINCKQKQ